MQSSLSQSVCFTLLLNITNDENKLMIGIISLSLIFILSLINEPSSIKYIIVMV